MIGMSRTTGKRLDGLDHLRQSVIDILTTPVGSRVMRRDYGSRLPSLVDRPMNPEGLVEIYAAAAEALEIWEPRIRVTRIGAVIEDGTIIIELTGQVLLDGQNIKLDGIML